MERGRGHSSQDAEAVVKLVPSHFCEVMRHLGLLNYCHSDIHLSEVQRVQFVPKRGTLY